MEPSNAIISKPAIGDFRVKRTLLGNGTETFAVEQYKYSSYSYRAEYPSWQHQHLGDWAESYDDLSSALAAVKKYKAIMYARSIITTEYFPA